MKYVADSLRFSLTCCAALGTLVAVSTLRADQAAAPSAPTATAPASTQTPTTPVAERRIDYNWDVRPILSDNCFRCHGPDEKARQVNLRLDTPEGAYAALRRAETHAIVPGKPDESQLIFRVTHESAAMRMPPRTTNKVLSAEQIETLRRWIAQGAEYKPHWAFVAPAKPVPPQVMAAHRVSNDIDRFILARLDREGLSLSNEADKETLINRVTLMLTGLPPTLAEVDAFLQDTSKNAYETLVDRLLASTAYGEHMTNQWLDVARYAESDGFLDDLHDRLFWPYRDWVISAFNRNMPFDQFATWQLAGDLLPEATKEQKLATAFLRVGKRSTENGAIDEEYRVEYAVDRAVTVGTGFLAMTVGCARCHDHKYDPIPTKDFYSLTGFFNSTDEPGFYAPGRTGVTAGPTLLWTDEATEKKIAEARAVIRQEETAFEAAKAQAAREAAGRANALVANRDELRQTIQRSLDRGLAAHYPFENTAPIPDDQLPAPLPQARLSPSPMAVETLEGRCLSNNGPLVSDEECREQFRAKQAETSTGDDASASDEGQPANAASGRPARARRLPGDLIRDELVHSPSAGGGAPPAVLMAPDLREGIKGKGFYLTDEDQRGFLGKGVGYYERTQPFSLDVWVKAAKVYEDSTILNHRESENAGNAGYQLNFEKNHLIFEIMHSRAGNGILLRSREDVPVDQWTHITVTYDGSSRAKGTKLYMNGNPLDVEVLRDNLRSTIIPNGNANVSDQAFGLAFGKRARSQTPRGGAVDEIRVFRTALTATEVRYLHQQVQPSAFPDPTAAEIVELLTNSDARVEQAQAALTKARDVENELVSVQYEVMIMGDTPTPRPTYVLVRGSYEDHGEQVPPNGLSRVLPWNDQWPQNRVGLAKWLFDSKNPLTARVFVNRVWQGHFGRGLVETSEDFGSQGAIPTNPELLDYLAVSFIESGWNIKQLHKTIVMSSTFRQQSDTPEELLKKDPRNVLLARFSRARLPAEMVRDNAIAASGLLIEKLGGPSTYPYQPKSMWDGFNVYVYPNADQVPADSHHRRSLYSFVKRNAPHPGVAPFDMSERGTTIARRPMSNTPLQALVLLDDPQYVEAYRSLAAHALKSAPTKDAQLTTVFRLATRRRPLPEEMATMRKYYDSEVAHFSDDPQAAQALVNVGVTAPDGTVDVVQLAAMTNLTTVVMNSPDAYSLR